MSCHLYAKYDAITVKKGNAVPPISTLINALELVPERLLRKLSQNQVTFRMTQMLLRDWTTPKIAGRNVKQRNLQLYTYSMPLLNSWRKQ